MAILRSYACLLFFSVLLTACQRNEKETLVIYSPHGKELLGEFEKLYEAKHPTVDVQWLDMGSQEVFDRIRTESQNPQADLWWGAPSTMFMRAEKMGLLQPFKPTWADQVPSAAKSKGDAWYGTFSTPQVIAFNSNKLTTATVPQDWNEIVLPEWKDKIILRNPMASGTLRAIFSAQIEQSIKRSGSEADGWDWLGSLNENVKAYAADPAQMYAQLAANSEAVTLWNMPDIVLQKNKNNFPFGYVFPKQGTVVLTDAIAIVNGTKKAKTAADFYEFVTSKESLLLQAEKYYRIPSRTDIDRNELPLWLKNSQYTALDIDWDLISAKEADWMKRWDAEIKSKK